MLTYYIFSLVVNNRKHAFYYTGLLIGLLDSSTSVLLSLLNVRILALFRLMGYLLMGSVPDVMNATIVPHLASVKRAKSCQQSVSV